MTNFSKNSFIDKRYLILLIDAFIVSFVFMVATFIRNIIYMDGHVLFIEINFLLVVIIAAFFHLCSFYIFNLYNFRTKRSNVNLMMLISLSAILAVSLITFVSFFVPAVKPGRLLISVHLPLLVVMIYYWRKLFRVIFFKGIKKNILLFASEDSINQLSDLLRKNPIFDYNLSLSIIDYRENPGFVDITGNMYNVDLESLVKEKNIDTIVISEKFKNTSILKQYLINLKFKGFEIFNFATFYKNITSKVPVFNINDDDILFSYQDKSFHPPLYLKLKRLLDIIFSLAGLILSAPILPILALAIKLDTKGPVIFKQERLGMSEKPFTLLKFRTMVVDAEKDTGPKWSSAEDSRITRLGKFLRQKRLDEIPQFINILKGEMSFVGPRPIRRYFADNLKKEIPFYRLRFTVKPGITGWAQVKGDYGGSRKGQLEKFEYELFYIQNRSILLDIFISLKTIQTVLLRRGE